MLILHNFGEPLLNDHIADMVRFARSKRVAGSIQFATNGVQLTPRLSRDLVLAGLDGLVISVDALTKEEYSVLKGRDCLATVMDNAREFMRIKRELKSATPHVCAKMVRRKGHEKEQREFLKLWSGIVDEAALSAYSNWGGVVGYEGDIAVPHRRYACHFPWYYPVVNWDGRVFFCCAACHDDAVIGDLNDASLYAIWHGAAINEIRQAHLDGRFSANSTCSRCTYWSESRVNLDTRLRRLKKRL
jgi:radical SAM protein with 4Fe4S-binding SPASM domain